MAVVRSMIMKEGGRGRDTVNLFDIAPGDFVFFPKGAGAGIFGDEFGMQACSSYNRYLRLLTMIRGLVREPTFVTTLVTSIMQRRATEESVK